MISIIKEHTQNYIYHINILVISLSRFYLMLYITVAIVADHQACRCHHWPGLYWASYTTINVQTGLLRKAYIKFNFLHGVLCVKYNDVNLWCAKIKRIITVGSDSVSPPRKITLVLNKGRSPSLSPLYCITWQRLEAVMFDSHSSQTEDDKWPVIWIFCCLNKSLNYGVSQGSVWGLHLLVCCHADNDNLYVIIFPLPTNQAS